MNNFKHRWGLCPFESHSEAGGVDEIAIQRALLKFHYEMKLDATKKASTADERDLF